MTRPVRLRLSRRKGFRLHLASRALNGLPVVNVARPGRWGNPFPWRGPWIERQARRFGYGDDEAGCRRASVELYHRWTAGEIAHPAGIAPPLKAELAPLRGKNLACWCALDQPCHADVLLAIANSEHVYPDANDE